MQGVAGVKHIVNGFEQILPEGSVYTESVWTLESDAICIRQSLKLQ